MRTGSLAIGIDPGKSGAIAGIWTDEETFKKNRRAKPYWVLGIPYLRNYCTRGRDLDTRTIRVLFENFVTSLGERDKIIVAIEGVWANPNGQKGITRYIGDAKLIEGIGIGCGVDVQSVPPKSWRAYYPELQGGGDYKANKAASLELARKLFPLLELVDKKDDGKAEALLIAKYALEVLSDVQQEGN